MSNEEPEDTCPLCASTGAPKPDVAHTQVKSPNANGSSADQAPSSTGATFVWIGCTKCSEWYHSVCILLDEETKKTVPDLVTEEIEKNHQDEGPWWNWSKYMDRWFCRDCLSLPVVGRHHPLVPTVKKSFPPKPKPAPAQVSRSTSVKKAVKRSPSIISATVESPTAKRLRPTDDPGPSYRAWSQPGNDFRMDNLSLVIGDRAVGKPEGSAGPNGAEVQSGRPETKPGTTPKSEAASMAAPDEDESNNKVAPEDKEGKDESSSSSRPKRQAAMNRPDYHALHHHISTPTARWLDLIHDPDKYGVIIKDGPFPSLPGHLLSKAWIESSNTPDGRNEVAAEPSPSHSNSAALSTQPPSPPPTLFYGAQREPIVIRSSDGGFTSMGGKLPDKSLTVADVAKLVGPDVMVPVIDVATQQSSNWPLSQWASYVQSRADPNSTDPQASKVYNIISLEITGTELAKRVSPPTIVREIDWVDNFWNYGASGKPGLVQEMKKHAIAEERNGHEQTNGHGEDVIDGKGTTVSAPGHEKKGKGNLWPKVQLYCLMGTKGSWTDWHVDFAASSVYYTVHTGAKTFFFIRPTEQNLKAYQEWSGSFEKQHSTWLGDMCDEVRKVTLHAGDTMIIPAGYIHSVYTPLDSIVFGGNFVHSYDIPTQLRLRQIEIDTKVPQRFRFPLFDKLCWYVGERYCNDLRQLRMYRPRPQTNTPQPVHPRILQGLESLADFLVSQVSVLEDPDAEDRTKKAVYDKIPSEIIKDPSALARELQWRVAAELNTIRTTQAEHDAVVADEVMWQGDIRETRNGKRKIPHPSVAAVKRKPKELRMVSPGSRTDNFHPPAWDITVQPEDISTTTTRRQKPNANTREEEEAVEERRTSKQSRKRIRHLSDGRTILEETEVTIVETRVVWDESKVEMRGVQSGVEGGMCVDG